MVQVSLELISCAMGPIAGVLQHCGTAHRPCSTCKWRARLLHETRTRFGVRRQCRSRARAAPADTRANVPPLPPPGGLIFFLILLLLLAGGTYYGYTTNKLPPARS